LAYLPAVAITIELPDLESQTEFNLARWAEVLADPALTTLPHRIETDQHGHILMSPPPAPIHGRRQAHIAGLLRQLLPDGIAFSECPLSTGFATSTAPFPFLLLPKIRYLLLPFVRTLPAASRDFPAKGDGDVFPGPFELPISCQLSVASARGSLCTAIHRLRRHFSPDRRHVSVPFLGSPSRTTTKDD
jgi:hypothetical protein